MIYESYVYKDELSRIYKRVHKRKTQKRWLDHSLFLLEKDCFIAFFLIRKLLEAKTKVTKELIESPIKLTKYKANDRNATILNSHRIDELYKINQGSEITKNLEFICNQAIHSFTFIPVISNNGGLEGILLNSLYEKNKALYKLSIEEFLRILSAVSNSYTSTCYMKYNPNTQDFEVIEAQ